MNIRNRDVSQAFVNTPLNESGFSHGGGFWTAARPRLSPKGNQKKRLLFFSKMNKKTIDTKKHHTESTIPNASQTKKSLQSRRQVRFDQDVTIYQEIGCNGHDGADQEKCLNGSTWLSRNDYSKIYEGVFHTLDEMAKRSYDERGQQNEGNSYADYCVRGLEDYSPGKRGRLKPSVIRRRQMAVHAVLHEQSVQRYRFRYEQNTMGPFLSRNDLCREKVPYFAMDDTKISKEYALQTQYNTSTALAIASRDFKIARAIHQETCCRF